MPSMTLNHLKILKIPLPPEAPQINQPRRSPGEAQAQGDEGQGSAWGSDQDPPPSRRQWQEAVASAGFCWVPAQQIHGNTTKRIRVAI